MRTILALLALAIAGTVFAAEPTTPRGVVLAHECRSINPEQAGFTCNFDSSGMGIVMHEDQAKMPDKRRASVDYQFYKIALRFFELGGRSFEAVSYTHLTLPTKRIV